MAKPTKRTRSKKPAAIEEPVLDLEAEAGQVSEREKKDKFKEITDRATKIKGDQSNVKAMYNELSGMYWIEDPVKMNKSAYGKNDIRYTKSPNARNDVVGLHRMLRTSSPTFKVKCKNEAYATRIEEALTRWWAVSSERKIAPVHSELALSAIMFSDTSLSVTAVDDLLDVPDLHKVRRYRLEQRKKQAAILFECEPAMTSYPVWGDDGLSEFLQVYKQTGKEVKQRWGEIASIEDDKLYTVHDYWDWEWRAVWLDEKSSEWIECDKHGLPDIPRFSAVADGTEQFATMDDTTVELHKRQPFLYAKWKAGLHQRESEALTTLFTSVYSRGVGPLAMIDPTVPNFDPNTIDVNYKGLFRYVIAKGTFADDKAYDANMIQLMDLLNNLGQKSTINAQTLGENIQSGTPYSGYAMAAQNGRIPLIPIQTAVEKVIHDACMYALRYFKDRQIEWEGLLPTEIEDDIELLVKLEVDLPQDMFRNAQTAAQLVGKVSDEWIRDLLQIKDSEKMTFDIMSERATQAAFEVDLPNLINEIMQMLRLPAPPTEPPPGGDMPPPDPGMVDPATQAQIPGGPAAAMAGGATMPATQPAPVVPPGTAV